MRWMSTYLYHLPREMSLHMCIGGWMWRPKGWLVRSHHRSARPSVMSIDCTCHADGLHDFFFPFRPSALLVLFFFFFFFVFFFLDLPVDFRHFSSLGWHFLSFILCFSLGFLFSGLDRSGDSPTGGLTNRLLTGGRTGREVDGSGHGFLSPSARARL